jgi:MFS family permease
MSDAENPGLLKRVLPERGPATLFALGSLFSSIGMGAFATGTALFFTRSVGLSVREVGLGLAIAGVFAALSSVPVGMLSDRFGPREVSIGLALLQTVLLPCYGLVHSFAAFLPIVVALAAAERGGGVVRNALVSGVMGREGRIRIKAYQRAVFNVGISIGTLLAAVPLALDSRAGYLALVFVNALASLATAFTTARLPRVAPVARDHSKPKLGALRDYRYIAVAATSGMLMIHHSLLTIAIPIWVATQTEAPRWIVAALIFVSTTIAILFQVPASRGADGLDGAARVMRRGAFVMLPACLILGLSGQFSPVVAVVVLILGVVLLTAAELWTSVGAWGFSFELADPARQGQYQGVFSMGMSLEGVVGPLVVTAIVLPFGLLGWAVVGCAFVLLGIVAYLVPRWAVSHDALPAQTGTAN